MSGDGSLYKRVRTRPDGADYTRWIAQVTRGPRGDRHVERRVARTKGEARELLNEMLKPPQIEQSLGAHLARWLDETARPTVSSSTARGYADAIALFTPIHDVYMADLTPEDIEETCNRMTVRQQGKDELGKDKPPRPASAKTVRNAQAMLRLALDVARDRGHIRDNPARRVPLRRVTLFQVEALTPARARAVLKAVEGDRFEAAYALALVGLRASEILGLAWDDVDVKSGTAHVRYQLVGSGETAARAQLKTAASHAPVPLPAFVTSRLKAHRTAQLAERLAVGAETRDGYVFVTEAGYAVNRNWLTKHFQKLLVQAGLPTMRLHDLRHGAASLLADEGVHPRVAQRLLRHATSKTTMDTYTHTTAAQEREAADALDRAIGGT